MYIWIYVSITYWHCYDYMTCLTFLCNLKRQRKQERERKEMRGQEKRDWEEKKKLDRQGRKIQIIALGSSIVSVPVMFGQ